MHEWVTWLIEVGGYWGIFFLMVMENVIPPIPSELIMGLGGMAVARGTMEFVPLLLVGTVGSVLGNCAWYALGDRLGYERLEPFVRRHGRWFAVNWDEIVRSSGFFRKHGQWAVFFLRFSPFLRTIISLPAGLTHMPLWKFLVFTAAGGAVWNALLLKSGEWVGARFQQAEVWLSWITIVTFAALACWYLWRVLTWKSES